LLTDLEALAEIVTQKRTALGYVELAPGGLCVYGYNSYQKSKAVQMDGERHKPREQRDYSLLFDPLDDAMLAQCTPLARVLDVLSGALRPLLGPRITDRLELLHAHSLDQSSRFVQFSVHDDTEENFRSRKHAWWYGKHAEVKLEKNEKAAGWTCRRGGRDGSTGGAHSCDPTAAARSAARECARVWAYWCGIRVGWRARVPSSGKARDISCGTR
jgi:hypothetical protein